MDAGEITSNALKYPLTDFKKVLILGILTILSSLIIPGFLVLGYVFKIIRSTMEDSSELPDFDEWTSMFVNGLKVFVVLFVYSLIPLILILFGSWAAILPMLTVPGAGSLLNPSISLELVSGMVLIGLGLLVVISFLILVALANMVHHNKLSAAFRLKEIISKIKEIGGVDYLIWYVIMLIIIGAVYYVSSFLIFPLIIGIIIMPLIIFPYLTIFFARSVALIYKFEANHEYYRHSKQFK
ncbi:MAG: DUF4013 domain-containing protein [Methanobacterium sp.]